MSDRLLMEFGREVGAASTAAEMRAEINKHRVNDSIVHTVMDLSDYHGLSGEDRYTHLAYMLLKQNHELRKLTLDTMNRSPFTKLNPNLWPIDPNGEPMPGDSDPYDSGK